MRESSIYNSRDERFREGVPQRIGVKIWIECSGGRRVKYEINLEEGHYERIKHTMMELLEPLSSNPQVEGIYVAHGFVNIEENACNVIPEGEFDQEFIKKVNELLGKL